MVLVVVNGVIRRGDNIITSGWKVAVLMGLLGGKFCVLMMVAQVTKIVMRVVVIVRWKVDGGGRKQQFCNFVIVGWPEEC